MPRIPNVKLEVYLVPHGYQADFFVHNQRVASLCRDYGGRAESRQVHIDALVAEIKSALDRLRARFSRAEEIEERARGLWTGLGVEDVIIKILQREFGVSRENAIGVLRKEMAKIKRMSIAEFREFGFLQEVNRQFFHPLGLALEVVVDDDGGEVLGGIWDYRDDPEGVKFAEIDLDKLQRVTQLQIEKETARFNLLGYIIQPFEGEA